MKIRGLVLVLVFFYSDAFPAGGGAIVSVLTLLLEDKPVTASWGANRVDETRRPDATWMGDFDGVTPLIVPENSTIEIALDSCVTEYCVLLIDQLQLADTVYLDRPKTKLLGLAGNRLTYLDSVEESGAFIEIGSNMEQIVIEGLNLDGRYQNEQVHLYGNDSVYGLLVAGEDINNIALINNEIHHINSDQDAHGIAVYGTGSSEVQAIQNLLIKGNEVHDMRTGYSESIAVNGNVKGWEISQNQVSYVNNIAIVAIGGEGTSATQISNGRVVAGARDAARFGFIQNNTITDMSTLSNPAYASQHSWAGGIYIDGARNIVVTDNVVVNAEWAYDIGVENCITAGHIVLEGNTATDSYFGDFLLGAYATDGYKENPGIGCDPLSSSDENEGHGYVENITVKNNQFNTTTPIDDQGTINLQYRIRQSVIIQTGVAEQHPDGVVSGDENSIRVVE